MPFTNPYVYIISNPDWSSSRVGPGYKNKARWRQEHTFFRFLLEREYLFSSMKKIVQPSLEEALRLSSNEEVLKKKKDEMVDYHLPLPYWPGGLSKLKDDCDKKLPMMVLPEEQQKTKWMNIPGTGESLFRGKKGQGCLIALGADHPEDSRLIQHSIWGNLKVRRLPERMPAPPRTEIPPPPLKNPRRILSGPYDGDLTIRKPTRPVKVFSGRRNL